MSRFGDFYGRTVGIELDRRRSRRKLVRRIRRIHDIGPILELSTAPDSAPLCPIITSVETNELHHVSLC